MMCPVFAESVVNVLSVNQSISLSIN